MTTMHHTVNPSAFAKVGTVERLPKMFWQRAALNLESEVERLQKQLADIEAQQRISELLTPRESQVLRLLACGLWRYQIAERLGISSVTVNHYQGIIYRKLNVNSQTQAMLYALRSGLITVDEAWEVVQEVQRTNYENGQD